MVPGRYGSLTAARCGMLSDIGIEGKPFALRELRHSSPRSAWKTSCTRQADGVIGAVLPRALLGEPAMSAGPTGGVCCSRRTLPVDWLALRAPRTGV